MVFAFWEGEMPDYIKLCMKTWKFDYTLLDYESLKKYIKLPDEVKRFSLPQISDYIRAHVLRDYGGHYLDTDNILLSGELPEENITGYTDTRNHTLSVLHFKPHDPMLEAWCEYQDRIVADPNSPTRWSVFVNDFSDPWVKSHKEVTIHPLDNCWAEVYMIPGNAPRARKYHQFYFVESHKLSELKPTKLLMLHNSWTPGYYKKLSADEVLKQNCTLSNILREVL